MTLMGRRITSWRINATFFISAALFVILATPLAGHLPGIQPQEAHAAPATTYSFGVVPQFEQRRLYATWQPIIAELEKRTGLKFKLITTLKIEDFERAFFHGDFDFVYVNPYHIMRLHDTQPYVPLVADAAPLRGILVVRKDGPISNPSDLAGKTVALPSANALGASLLIRSDLDQLYHVTIKPLYVTTHSSVYLHVVKGLADAGGGVEKTLLEQDESVRSQLRVIYTSRACPSHPVAAHPRVPKADREKVKQALLDMNLSPEGRAMLHNVPVQQLVPASYDDYAPMQTWGLQKYWQPIQEGGP